VDDAEMMRLAMALAQQNPDSPIGCVIVLDDKIVAEAYNQVVPDHDPTAHAEIVAIRQACRTLKVQDLRGATLYSTLQPCGMCSMASIWSGITRIVYGAGRGEVHRMYFEDRHLGTMDFIGDAYRNDLSVEGGVLAPECAALYYGPNDDPPARKQTNI